MKSNGSNADVSANIWVIEWMTDCLVSHSFVLSQMSQRLLNKVSHN